MCGVPGWYGRNVLAPVARTLLSAKCRQQIKSPVLKSEASPGTLTSIIRSPIMVNMHVTPFGRELKRLRTEQGLTVRDLGSRLDKSIGYIGKIEAQGEVPNPALIQEIAEVFACDPRPLLALARESRIARAERNIGQKYPVDALESNSAHEKENSVMATVVSLINMKGGVGKTTLAMQLAHSADAADLKVLAIDLDPQSNLSQALMGPREYVAHLKDNKPTVAQIFDDYVPAGAGAASPRLLKVQNLILKEAGYWGKSTLDLIPSRLELSRTLKNPTGKERRLAKAIAQVQEDYDLIIIDCAPTESILTDAAYFASRYVIVPIKPEFMATIGLPLLARSLEEFQLENDDHEIEIAGIVFNHSSSYSSGPEGQRSIKEVTDFAKREGWYVCENQMKYSASYAKSAREANPISQTSYARWDVIGGFAKLKDEIFGLVGVQLPSKVTV
jgi:chromosome partitioning protein